MTDATDLTPERLAELRALAAKAPRWHSCAVVLDAVPELLDEIERLNYLLTESQTDLDNEREFRDIDDQTSEMRADVIREEWQLARAERDALAAKVARVEALRASWRLTSSYTLANAAEGLRVALAGGGR